MKTITNGKRLSSVEQMMLKNSPYELIYKPTEKLPSLITNNFPSLGKFTALRFIEWVQENPEGVISLPTGKTPEFFSKSLSKVRQKKDVCETENCELAVLESRQNLNGLILKLLCNKLNDPHIKKDF